MILLGKRLMVKEKAPKEKKSQGGILLTTETKTDYRTPVALEITMVDEALEAPFEVGKYALVMPTAGIDVTKDDVKYRIVNYEDVIAILGKEEI